MARRKQYPIGLALSLALLFSCELALSADLESDFEPKIQAAVETIAHNYLVEVKTIFKQACFDCHTNLTSYPWYYTVPVIKTKIDRDIAEAREHLDFSNDYPFMSDGMLTEDLKAIMQTIEDNSMPPLPYAVMHRTKTISNEQKKKVLDWAEESIKILSNAGYIAYIDP